MSETHYLKIAHRGASGSRPEHTRPAFERAIELGVDMIELDVQLTRDRRLVVMHDRELGRTVSAKGPVRECTLEELRAMDAGAWFDPAYAGEPPLSLDEVLDLTIGRVELNVEIKSPQADWEDTALALTHLLRARGCVASTIVSCFDLGALERVRQRDDAARVGVLWQKPELAPMWQAATALGAGSVHPHWALIDKGLVETAHTAGLKVIAWTVDEPEFMREFARIGVDGLISNFPERFP